MLFLPWPWFRLITDHFLQIFRSLCCNQSQLESECFCNARWRSLSILCPYKGIISGNVIHIRLKCLPNLLTKKVWSLSLPKEKYVGHPAAVIQVLTLLSTTTPCDGMNLQPRKYCSHALPTTMPRQTSQRKGFYFQRVSSSRYHCCVALFFKPKPQNAPIERIRHFFDK